MKKSIKVNLSLVDQIINEGVLKSMEKSGSEFRTIEKTAEIGTITLEKKEYLLFSADKDDKASGANYRIGEKIGSEYKTRPVIIDMSTNTIKILKDDGSWTQEFKIKKISIDNSEVQDEQVNESKDLLKEENEEDSKYTYRNYNLGRPIDELTDEFETELDNIIKKYDVYMETESFENH